MYKRQMMIDWCWKFDKKSDDTSPRNPLHKNSKENNKGRAKLVATQRVGFPLMSKLEVHVRSRIKKQV